MCVAIFCLLSFVCFAFLSCLFSVARALFEKQNDCRRCVAIGLVFRVCLSGIPVRGLRLVWSCLAHTEATFAGKGKRTKGCAGGCARFFSSPLLSSPCWAGKTEQGSFVHFFIFSGERTKGRALRRCESDACFSRVCGRVDRSMLRPCFFSGLGCGYPSRFVGRSKQRC